MNHFIMRFLIIISCIGLSLTVSAYTVLSSGNSVNSVVNSKLDSLSKSLFEDVEEEILQELKEQKKGTEVYALLSEGVWGGNGHIIIILDNEKATLKHIQGNGRFITRVLRKSELGGFLSFIEKESVDGLESFYNYSIADGIKYLYLHASKDKIISRVNIYSPSKVNEVYYLLVNMFRLLASEEGFSVNYEVSKKLKESKVVIPREKNEVLSVWKQKDDFRVFIRDNGITNWREFKNGTIGGIVSEPQGFTLKGSWADIPKDYRIYYHLNYYPWKVKWGEYTVRILDALKGEYRDGIWLTKGEKSPVLIHEGRYSSPVVIPGSDWVIVAKTNINWAEPNTVVKINLRTKQECDLGIPPAETLYPIAYVSEHKKILLIRQEDFNSNEEYLFYDITTGKSEKKTGDFEPLCQPTYKPLQLNGRNNEYWAAIPDYGENKTDFGVYNAKTFTFKELFSFEDIIFNSMNMWVDYESAHIYVVTNDDLIQLPFIK